MAGVVAGLVSALGGCAASVDHPSEFTFAISDYQSAFDTTREVLREYRFEIARIDADAGVIATAPAFSPGVLAPWSPLQTGVRDEWEDTLNQQAREVRVTFEPQDDETMRGSVWVTLLRQHRAGRRLDSEWVGASSFSIDPQLVERHASTYTVPVRRDESLEARLAKRIEDELLSSAAATNAESTPAADTEAPTASQSTTSE